MAKAIYARQGVYLDKLNDAIRRILPHIIEIYEDVAYQTIVLVTSTYESSSHMASSFHYVHKAIDILCPFTRYYTMDEEKSGKVHKALIKKLGKEYDVIWHKEKGTYHIEHDPK